MNHLRVLLNFINGSLSPNFDFDSELSEVLRKTVLPKLLKDLTSNEVLEVSKIINSELIKIQSCDKIDHRFLQFLLDSRLFDPALQVEKRVKGHHQTNLKQKSKTFKNLVNLTSINLKTIQIAKVAVFAITDHFDEEIKTSSFKDYFGVVFQTYCKKVHIYTGEESKMSDEARWAYLELMMRLLEKLDLDFLEKHAPNKRFFDEYLKCLEEIEKSYPKALPAIKPICYRKIIHNLPRNFISQREIKNNGSKISTILTFKNHPLLFNHFMEEKYPEKIDVKDLEAVIKCEAIYDFSFLREKKVPVGGKFGYVYVLAELLSNVDCVHSELTDQDKTKLITRCQMDVLARIKHAVAERKSHVIDAIFSNLARTKIAVYDARSKHNFQCETYLMFFTGYILSGPPMNHEFSAEKVRPAVLALDQNFSSVFGVLCQGEISFDHLQKWLLSFVKPFLENHSLRAVENIEGLLSKVDGFEKKTASQSYLKRYLEGLLPAFRNEN